MWNSDISHMLFAFFVLYLDFLFCIGLSVQSSSIAQWCLTLCDPMYCSTPGFLVHHQLPELAQTHKPGVSDAIQPSHPLLSPFPPAFNLSQHQGFFWKSQFFTSGGQSIRVSSSGISPSNEYSGLISIGLTGRQFIGVQLSLWANSHTELTLQTFVGEVLSLLFNMLPMFFIACLPRSKCFDFMAAVTIWVDFGGQENKVSHCFHCLPFICHEVMRLDAMILVSWMLSFKPDFSLSSFTFIKRLFVSLLCAIRVVLSAYLRLLIFLPAILIPDCASFSLAFHMMYSTCKLNKPDDNIQLWGTAFSICNQSAVPYPVLTVASWPAYRFLRRQIR